MYIPESIRKLKRHLMKRRDGERILRQRFQEVHGHELDTTNARTFSEKLYAQMISANRRIDPRLVELCDKLRVRSYVERTIGKQYLTPLLWSGPDPYSIPFDRLPDRCMAKANHGSGYNLLLERPFDEVSIVATLRAWCKRNYYWAFREYQYYEIKPRILIEDFLVDSGRWPLDYRFWCFRGKPEVIQVDNHAHDINPFYDLTWNRIPLWYRNEESDDVLRPENLPEMIDIASRLSSGFGFVRVDLYCIKGRSYFGEMTFAPAAGTARLRPEEWELRLGDKWTGS
jgi:TupA-like ATPgrasp